MRKFRISFFNPRYDVRVIEAESRIKAVKTFREKWGDVKIISIDEI